MKKQKDPNRLKFSDYFGTTTLAVTSGIGHTIMTGLFMLYLTDYAGIGKWGAILGGTLLMVARLFDAVNDPIQGWIMDRAKVGKHGKYRPFLLLSIIMISVGLIGLFSMPESFGNNPVMICIWVILFYLVYDMGESFYVPNLLYRTIALDANARGRLIIGPRMITMLISMFGSAMIAIVNSVNENYNNMNKSFGVTITAVAAVTAVISLVGLLVVRERHHAVREKEDVVKMTDIFGLLKDNAALRIKLLEQIFSGFIWTFLFASMTYYIKWAYCADLTTGAVDTEKFGMLSLYSSLLMVLPLLLGTWLSTPIMKKVGSVIKFHRFLMLTEALPCLVLFILEVLGVLRLSPVPFFICAGITATAIGADYIPQETLNMECMDYEVYRSGRDRAALCNACQKFLGKAQNAMSSGMVGFILVAIGYEVDSVTDMFIGELSAIPTMLTWFIVIMGLVPGILGVVAWLILKKYPVTDEIRADMKMKLGR